MAVFGFKSQQVESLLEKLKGEKEEEWWKKGRETEGGERVGGEVEESVAC